MSVDKHRERVNNTIFGVVGTIIVFVFSNIVSSFSPISIMEVLLLSVSIIIIEFICWIIVCAIMNKRSYFENEAKKIGLSKLESENDMFEQCTKSCSVMCPLSVGLKYYNLDLKIDETTSEKDHLFEKDFVYEVEEKGRNNKPWKVIWIFSDNLSSEIDSDKKEVLVTNITNNETKYTIFHLNLNDENQLIKIDERKELLLNSLPDSFRRYLTFVTIDVSTGFLGNHTLPLLCGSILFCQNIKKGHLPDFSEGYLSIRNDDKDIPIYYKMPPCMLNEYTKYYKEIINNKKRGKL